MEFNKIYNQDCLEGMKQLDSNSVDCIVTDPPYGYSFMGKDWDKVVIDVDYWKECLRVLKHGSFAFVMSAPRQDVLSKMICNLSDAGFNVGFTSIYWTYASGFPKACNVSKMIDKRLGVERDITGINPNSRINKENHNVISFESRKGHIEYLQNNPATQLAKELDGSYAGFQPKPAVEIIIVAMKPLSEKSYVDQAMKNGKGVTWLDDCRIPYENINDASNAGKHSSFNPQNTIYKTGLKARNNDRVGTDGRFPANLLVSDDVLNDGNVSKSAGGTNLINKKTNFGQTSNIPQQPFHYQDEGSFSRYFDLDKWFSERIKKLPEDVRKTFPFLIVPKAASSERNKDLDGFEAKLPENLQIGQLKNLTGETWIDRKDGKGKVKVNRQYLPRKNIHPTVKPLKLMSYLITLGSRENNVILDPFIGSGTTAIAARMINRRFIGFEKEKEYYDIAQAKLNELMKHKFLNEF